MTRSLTAILAHPDDETFATGATLARYADEGVRLSVYCATDGDIGRSSDIPVSSRAELGARRRDELRAAAQVLVGPEGAPTQHRDHRAISRLATSAFLLAGTRTAFASQLDERYSMADAEHYFVAIGTPLPRGAMDLFAGL